MFYCPLKMKTNVKIEELGCWRCSCTRWRVYWAWSFLFSSVVHKTGFRNLDNGMDTRQKDTNLDWNRKEILTSGKVHKKHTKDKLGPSYTGSKKEQLNGTKIGYRVFIGKSFNYSFASVRRAVSRINQSLTWMTLNIIQLDKAKAVLFKCLWIMLS